MKLVIAEKPSVAMALASVLGARTRKDGYVEGNGYLVSWCVGHLVGLCDASEMVLIHWQLDLMDMDFHSNLLEFYQALLGLLYQPS